MTDSFLKIIQEHNDPSAIAFQARGIDDLSYTVLSGHIQSLHITFKAMGIDRNDPIAFVADNNPATAILALSLMSYCTALPINPDFKENEVRHLTEIVSPKILFIPELLSISLDQVLGNIQIPIIEYSTSQWQIDFVTNNSTVEIRGGQKRSNLPQDTALVLQTSGSTSLPRIVPLSRENLQAATTNVIQSLALTQKDSCLHMLPMFHIGGLVDVLLAPLMSGGRIIFNRGFDVEHFLNLNQAYKPTWSQTVPAMLKEILEYSQRHSITLTENHFRFIRSVSAPLPEELYHAAVKAFSTAIVEIYGMTECAGVIASNPVETGLQKPGSVGISAGPEIRICDESGIPVMNSEAGEIQVRGGSTMQGYISLDNQQKSDFNDRWFRTGDLGYLDEDGYLYLTGRVKDIINRGGEKISPAEIDNLVLTHSSVVDAASFPVEHPSLGEDIALALVLGPDENVTEGEIKTYLRERVAYFKVPGDIHIMDEIPRYNGKLRRRNLAEVIIHRKSEGRKEAIKAESMHTPLTRELILLWSEVLENQDINQDSDFFFMGGDSLSATILVNKINEKWEVPILVSAIYDAPVLQEFEKHLTATFPDLPRQFNT